MEGVSHMLLSNCNSSLKQVPVTSASFVCLITCSSGHAIAVTVCQQSSPMCSFEMHSLVQPFSGWLHVHMMGLTHQGGTPFHTS